MSSFSIAPIKKVAVIFVEKQYEVIELYYARFRFVEEGWTVHLVGPTTAPVGTVYPSKEDFPCKTTTDLKSIDPLQVDAIVAPGGFCSDWLRRDTAILEFIRAAYREGHGAVVAAVCHGPWLLVSANILRGKHATCFIAIKDDVINAGAIYEPGMQVVVDGKLVTAQHRDDMPAFMKAIFVTEAAAPRVSH